MLLENEKEQDIIEIKDFTVLAIKNEKEIEQIEEEHEERKKQRERQNKEEKNFFLGNVLNRIIIAISLFLIFASIFLVQFCIVSGESMYPTLSDRDVVFIEKVTKEYERMDIVVIKNNGKYLIKRIIALPGEKIKIENGKVLINDKEVEDIIEGKINREGIAKEAILLGSNEYFLLGDNREESVDSRDEVIGIVKKENIVGKSVFVFSFFE